VIIAHVIEQHAEDAAVLAANRSALVKAPNVRLKRLQQFDQRLSAHLDGLRLAGEEAWALCQAALETPSPGAVFTLGVGALEVGNASRFDALIALVQAVPEACAGLLQAIGWVEPSRLQGRIASLLGDRDGFRRLVGIAACATHRVDPGIEPRRFLEDVNPAVRARAFRTAGDLGLSDLVSCCVGATRGDDNPEVQFWAARSAVLLGGRQAAIDTLMTHALQSGAHAPRAFRLALQAVRVAAAHAVLLDLPRDQDGTRRLIEGSGIAGDPAYVPWLITHMSDLKTARLAGEAFTLIAGVDMGADALDRPAPENFESGPNDDPDDPDVDLDPDDGLPWPDVPKVERWWADNESRFQKGTRYFMGVPVTRDHCINVLKSGYQRQRILAAHYLCLLEPGTPLFNTAAPAWRQQRDLAKTT
jgi:uncharacterized protein (TIGR02270 family)